MFRESGVAPLNFLLVGALGRAFSANLDQLYMIGRAVTIASVAITMLVLGVFLNRRYGAVAAALGMVLSVGVGILSGGAHVPSRRTRRAAGPDRGLPVGCRSAVLAFAGGLSLWLAAATKQTVLVYLLAGVIGLFLQASASAPSLSLPASRLLCSWRCWRCSTSSSRISPPACLARPERPPTLRRGGRRFKVSPWPIRNSLP